MFNRDKPKTDTNPNITTGSFKQSRLLSKRLLATLTIVIVGSVLAILYFNSRSMQPNNNPPKTEQELQALIKEEEQFYPEGYTKPDELEELYTVQGQVVSVSGDMITLKTEKETKSFKLVEKSEFFKGVEYEKADISAIKPGDKAQITYNESSNQVDNVWSGL